MIITGSIITAIVVLLVISLILFYNGMVRGRNMVEEAWSGISVQLKRRHDLVPVLVNSVKGYMTHEQETLTRIAELRASAVSASSSGSVQAIAHAENQLMGALRSLFAVSENYPDLRANENFMQLQEQLSLLEDEIQLSRRYYNGTARDQNNRVLQFPGNLVARSFGFARVEYFELADPKPCAASSCFFCCGLACTVRQPLPSGRKVSPLPLRLRSCHPALSLSRCRPAES